MKDESAEFWNKNTRDRWFFAVLALATAAVLLLFSRFLYVLLFAVVTVVVSWPVYRTILKRFGGRRALSALSTLAVLFVLVFGPLSTLVIIFVSQAAVVVQRGIAWVQAGGPTTLLATIQGTTVPQIEAYLGDLLGRELDLVGTVTGPLQSALLTILEGMGSAVPQVISRTANLSIDVVIFLFAVVTLYMEGPNVLRVVKNLSPMDDAYDDQLFSVFHKFANNMVIGSLVTAAIQGLVASVGYVIAGADQIVFLGICTALGAFIPIIGTAFVWIPVVFYVGATQGIGWAIFVALWSLIVTGTIDNVVKPMFLRGGTNIHPLLIFLGVFGGLSWMGIPGVLVGPVIVAFFLALYTIYVRDFLDMSGDEEPTVSGAPSPLAAASAPAEAATVEAAAKAESPAKVDPDPGSTPGP